MLLLVGLGNPGSRHANNRHNIGFMAVEAIAQRHGFSPWRRRFQGQTAEGSVDGVKVLALKPETYMNESGQAVGEALRFFKLEPSAVLVIYDEIDLAPGKIKVKRAGGSGGHNGIRSIDMHIGPDYRRVRLGVGHPGHRERVHGHVLRDFAKQDRDWLGKLLDTVADEFPRLVKGDESGFMSRVALVMNPPKPKPEKTENDAPRNGAPEARNSESDGL